MLTVLYNAKVNASDEAVLIEDAFISQIGSNEEILNRSYEAIPVDVNLCEIRHAKKLVKKDVFDDNVLEKMNELVSQGYVSVTTNVSEDVLRKIQKVFDDNDAPLRCELYLNADTPEEVRSVKLSGTPDPWLKISGCFVKDLECIAEFFAKSNEVKVPLAYDVSEAEETDSLKPYCNKFHKLFHEEVIKGATVLKPDEVADLIVMRNGRAIMTLNEGYIVYRRK